jgi:photosystem II stability/assembly factor-like uncharacterized protein
MKNFIVIQLFLLVFSLSTNAQWTWQHPYPQGNELRAIQMNGSLGWAVGAFGTVMKTTNEGYNWEIIDVGTKEVLNSITFSIYNDVWIVGDNGLIKYSSDDGTTWIDHSGVTSKNLNSVSFVYGACAWICGDEGIILKTTDEGENWDVLQTIYTLDLNAIDSYDCGDAWAVGTDGLIISTSDGGSTWVSHPSSTSYNLYSIDLVEFGYYRACGQGGTIVHSTDQGATWQLENSSLSYNLFSVDTKGIESYAYAVGSDGVILETTNNGVSWNTKAVNFSYNFNDVVWQALFHNIYAVGYYGVVYRNSGIGTDFELQNAGTRVWLFSSDFINENVGWVVGGDPGWGGTTDGVILKTTDGGVNWIEQLNLSTQFDAVDFINENEGWVVGHDGLIRHTVNGGQTWNVQNSPASADLYALHFLDENIGWAVGRYSQIIHTTNGGGTWSSQVSGTPNWLYGVYFIDSNNGWAVGSDSTIIHTTNGGANWTRVISNASNGFRFTDVYFTDEMHGWVTGIYGSILLTTNGGASWQEVESNHYPLLNSVYFLDNNNGWIVGNSGIILRSTDGGFNWFVQSRDVTGYFLCSVFFTDYNNGWITGEGGTILHTNNGGAQILSDEFWKNNVNLPINDFTLSEDYIDVVVPPDYLQDHQLVGVMLMVDTVLHTSDSDLQFTLSHSTITDTVIYRVGADGDNFINTRLTDVADINIDEGSAPFTGQYKPHQPLSSFAGLDPNGEWKLSIYDAASGNTGMLKAWGLKLYYAIPVDVESDYSIIPDDYVLFQNYPNPFNPSTKITYQIPASLNPSKGGTLITLIVYDILGSEIATLVNEEKAAGKYEVQFNASQLSSGIYFYQLKADEFIQTKKMVIVR